MISFNLRKMTLAVLAVMLLLFVPLASVAAQPEDPSEPGCGRPGLKRVTLRKFSAWLLYAVYLCVFVVGLGWLMHSFQLRALREQNFPQYRIEGLPFRAEVARKLGWFRNPKPNAFPHFQLEKPEGTIRIGCFGDSFTAGTEVAAVMARFG